MTNGPRSYRSPLREAQTGRTRILILDTMADMLAGGRMNEVSIRRLAEEARVSERTVYRYFPDRQSLLDTLATHVGERLGTNALESSIESAEEIVRFIPVVFAQFDEFAELSKAEIMLNPDPAAMTEDRRQRTQRMMSAVSASFPDMDPDDQQRLGALVRTLAASYTWLRLRGEFGLSGGEAGDLVAWVMRLMFADVAAGGALPARRAAEPPEDATEIEDEAVVEG